MFLDICQKCTRIYPTTFWIITVIALWTIVFAVSNPYGLGAGVLIGVLVVQKHSISYEKNRENFMLDFTPPKLTDEPWLTPMAALFVALYVLAVYVFS